MSVDMNLLKQLREATFAPLKDCKDALVEANGDLQQAKEILKEKWILKAGKKSERETNEWIVKVVNKNGKIAWIKLLCETDFVAKNDEFIQLCDDLLDKVLAENVFFLSKQDAPTNLSELLDKLVKEAVWTIWENMQLDDIILTNENGFVYNHPGNKVASIVFWMTRFWCSKRISVTSCDYESILLGLWFCSKWYRFSNGSTIPPEILDSWKPENMVDQILKWKLSKALAEDVLLEQEYIRDGSKK